MLEIEYKFREEDLIRYNELKYKNNEDYLKNIKRNRWIYPGLMGLISLYFWSYNQDIEQALYVLAIALLWMLVAPWVITWQMKQKVLMSYSEQEMNDMFGDYRLFIDPKDPSFLQERSPSGKNKVEWKELLRVDYEKKQVHYVFDTGAALIIPTETVSKGSLEKFSEQVEKQIERHDD